MNVVYWYKRAFYRKGEIMAKKENPVPKIFFGAVIQSARKAKGLSQQGLADRLGVSRVAVNNWEADNYKPDHDYIPALCRELDITLGDLYSVDDKQSLSPAERRIIGNFRFLTENGKNLIGKVVNDVLDEEIAAQDKYLKENFAIFEVPASMASAGYGSDLLEAPPGYVFLRRNHRNSRADAVIEVTGDSMLPVYRSGDFVYVEYTETAFPGEDVVCTMEGGGIIKRMNSEHKLESLNPDYPFGERGEWDNIRLVGRVLGIVDKADMPDEREKLSLDELFADEIKEFLSLHGGDD